ncbi:PRD domain-containing protein [Arcanobacterium buesumense]|uniref:PRD domain-containing protein n=2 Tax=Arcanobacterium buesumense TaxID=2722751 RepID=A0A6H2EMW9_9ACTO|nr:PRD domain-containing protein [Arcanobacterium buesumense]QJC22419.1 PRD domain-containing protein [Arcanobacterium buesumense]
MIQSAACVLRVFNNNAVLVSVDGVKTVLAGRGIGFGKRPGDMIPAGGAWHQFIEASADRIDFLTSVNTLDPHLVSTVTEAVELANNLINDLDPSIYVVLVDHMAFAVQRHLSGLSIHNKLVDEIKVAFGVEFTAAQIMVHFVNHKLNVELPVDEVAFIALHLHAARTGVTVKQPLSEANELGVIVDLIMRELGQPKNVELTELLFTINGYVTRIHAGMWRTNTATSLIERMLAPEFAVARHVITYIAKDDVPPAAIAHESAFLAVFLHGWRQGTRPAHTQKDTTTS